MTDQLLVTMSAVIEAELTRHYKSERVLTDDFLIALMNAVDGCAYMAVLDGGATAEDLRFYGPLFVKLYANKFDILYCKEANDE